MMTVSLLLIMSLFSFGENVSESLTSQRDWSTTIVEDHLSTAKRACMAATKSSARLEVYAESSEFEGFVEPLVQIVALDSTDFLGGELKFGNGRTFAISKLPTTGASRFVTKWADQPDVLSELKRGLTVTATLLASGGQSETHTFSLRGSSHNIGTLESRCK